MEPPQFPNQCWWIWKDNNNWYSTAIPITRYPDIYLSTRTGTNLKITPVTELVVDPIDVDPENVIQITDLAGLKQTGYIQVVHTMERFTMKMVFLSQEDTRLLVHQFRFMLLSKRASTAKSLLDLLQFRDLVLMSPVMILDLIFQELLIILFK